MLSIVIPVFNEEESLHAFFAELSHVLPDLSKEHEIIFIDDGSTDSSLTILKHLETKDTTVKVFSFRRNMGKAEALTFGFMQAKGDQIVTLDADLQDKPTEIDKLLEKAKTGVEVVCGWRKNRRDKSNMKVISKLFNAFVGKFFGLQIHDYNCGMKVYTNDAAKSLRLYGGLHRFIPILASQNGFSIDEVAIEHQPRRFGKSKYNFSKVFKDLPDMFTMLFLVKYSKRPMHFFGMIGGFFIFIGLVLFGYLSIIWLMGESIGGRPLFLGSILLLISGLQFFFTGFLSDLIINLSQMKQSAHEVSVHFPLKYRSSKK